MARGQERSVNPLESIIHEHIAASGSIPFREFMELALTHPDFGYYSVGKSHPGRAADFFTSVSVGACFGDLLAMWVHERWLEAGQPEHFDVVEQGCHTGLLAADILTRVSANFPALYRAIRYTGVEIGVQAFSEPALEPHAERLRRVDSLDALPLESICGCFLANELVDAFPVHRVCWQGEAEGWQEWHVTHGENRLDWCLRPIAEPAVLEALADIDLSMHAPGTSTEVNLAQRAWLAALRKTLNRADLLIIDYGFEAQAYHSPTRRDGTLQAYSGHRRHGELLAQPGQQDLTAHVNLTALQADAESAGFEVRGLRDQHHFLTELAREPLLAMEARSQESGPSRADAKWLRQFQQLSHPTAMGRLFHMLELRTR